MYEHQNGYQGVGGGLVCFVNYVFIHINELAVTEDKNLQVTEKSQCPWFMMVFCWSESLVSKTAEYIE